MFDVDVLEYAPWDVNEDGKVDATDIGRVASVLRQDEDALGDDTDASRADVNGDGTVDNADVLLVASHVPSVENTRCNFSGDDTHRA